jgi:hypothetical protein
LPIAHFVQAYSTFAAAFDQVPSAHCEQLAAVALVAYSPAPQLLQAVIPVSPAYFPALQFSQPAASEVLPTPCPCLPAAHFVHALPSP